VRKQYYAQLLLLLLKLLLEIPTQSKSVKANQTSLNNKLAGKQSVSLQSRLIMAAKIK